jgi:ankyrin repeat protein
MKEKVEMNKKLLIQHVFLFSLIVVLLTSNALKPMKRSVADVSQGAADLQYNKRQKTTENVDEEAAENLTSFSGFPRDVKEKIIAASSNRNTIGAVDAELNKLASIKNFNNLAGHDPFHFTLKGYQYLLIQALIKGEEGIVSDLRRRYESVSEYRLAGEFICSVMYPLMNDLTKAVLSDNREEVKKFIDQKQHQDPSRLPHITAIFLTPIFIATYFGYIDLLKYFFNEKLFDFTLKTADGYSLLHIAAQSEFFDVIQFLLNINNNGLKDAYFDVNEETLLGTTPIMLATANNNIENIKLLLQHGASIEKKADHGHEMITMDKEQAVQYYPDFYAAAAGNIELLKDIQDSQKTNEQQSEGGINGKVTQDGCSLLHVAAEKNDPEVIQFLIDLKKIDINGKDCIKVTPLHVAVVCNNVDNFILLLKAGADPYSRDEQGNTILGMAIYCGCVDVVEELLPFYKKEFAQGKSWEFLLLPLEGKEDAIQYAQERRFDRIVEMLSALEDGV